MGFYLVLLLVLAFLGANTLALPTAKPSDSPTLWPSHSPVSSKPTGLPTTSKPTHVPTARPSLSPSRPTPRPTLLPTHSPTNSHPTLSPLTRKPTDAPTSKPTRMPTHSPTIKPSHSPTPRPTSHPSSSPTPPTTNSPTYCASCVVFNKNQKDELVRKLNALRATITTSAGPLPQITYNQNFEDGLYQLAGLIGSQDFVGGPGVNNWIYFPGQRLPGGGSATILETYAGTQWQAFWGDTSTPSPTIVTRVLNYRLGQAHCFNYDDCCTGGPGCDLGYNRYITCGSTLGSCHGMYQAYPRFITQQVYEIACIILPIWEGAGRRLEADFDNVVAKSGRDLVNTKGWWSFYCYANVTWPTNDVPYIK